MRSMSSVSSARLWLVLLSLLNVCQAFYLPGVAPTDYKKDDRVPLLVNSISSAFDLTSRSIISYNYYFKAFKFCQPAGGPQKQGESLGSILFGDRIFNSPYELFMLKNETCKSLCTVTYDARDISFISARILGDYENNWLIDGLPAASVVRHHESGKPEDDPTAYYDTYSLSGIPLGEILVDTKLFYFYNHFDFQIDYHAIKGDKYRVVGVVVQPSSRNYAVKEGEEPKCEYTDDKVIFSTEDKESQLNVTFSYSVTWVPSSTSWATRWDRYLDVTDSQIHWFSLINSVIIVLFLIILVSTILVRALRKDIARYNEIDLAEDIQEDSGWKLIHGDVFRSPKHRMLLSVFIGSGSQLLIMVLITLVFALLGLLSPSNRGALSSVMILFYLFFGIVGGYVSGTMYKIFGGQNFKTNLILTPTIVPSIIFGGVIIMNFFLVYSKSSGAIPFGTMLFLAVLWFVISLPLSALGSFLAFRREVPAPPVRTNQIPRQIPIQPRYLRLLPCAALAGILPYEAIFIELYFILASFWTHKFYYLFGFLFVCFCVLVLTCAAVTVSLIYFSLCAENYHWQWRSFVLSGSCAVYIFLHSLVYLVSKLELGGFVSNFLYIGYSLLISFVFFILTGTVGFLASFVFMRRIYTSIKID